MKNKPALTIVLPVYNPLPLWDKIIADSLIQLFRFIDSSEVKILLVNDGSSINVEDGLNKLKNDFPSVEVISYKQNQGKGFAIREGLKHADSDYFIYTDWDFPFGEEAIYLTYQILLQQNSDLVIGIRTQKYFNSLPPFRRLISKSLRVVNFFYLNFKIVDTQAGIKGLSPKARQIFLTTKTNSFIYELEFVKACLREKVRISFLKVSPREDIIFNNFGIKTIYRELVCFIKLAVGRK